MLVVTAAGLMFCSSHPIQDYVGFHEVGGTHLLGPVSLVPLLPDVVTVSSQTNLCSPQLVPGNEVPGPAL